MLLHQSPDDAASNPQQRVPNPVAEGGAAGDIVAGGAAGDINVGDVSGDASRASGFGQRRSTR